MVNKGLSLSQLTKGSAVYGSVASAEDHGYVVTLGLDGVTAFLPKKDGPKKGLEPGQPVEAVIQARCLGMAYNKFKFIQVDFFFSCTLKSFLSEYTRNF